MNLKSIGFLIGLVLLCGVAEASLPRHPNGRLNYTAFIYKPEARFDPLIQRLLAEDVLRTMPGGDDVLYVVPEGGTKLLEEMQLRYLEELLHRYGNDAEPTAQRDGDGP